ncbi:MAG: MoxR family ATPase, partial [Acidobacteriota bacterium]
PFLGRCNFHHIAFPARDHMARIVRAHFPGIAEDLLRAALDRFYRLRDVPGVEKKPATRELVNWLRALLKSGVDASALSDRVPFPGILFKKSDDMTAVLARVNRGLS